MTDAVEIEPEELDVSPYDLIICMLQKNGPFTFTNADFVAAWDGKREDQTVTVVMGSVESGDGFRLFLKWEDDPSA